MPPSIGSFVASKSKSTFSTSLQVVEGETSDSPHKHVKVNESDGSAIDFLRKCLQHPTIPSPPLDGPSREQSKRRAISPFPPLEVPSLPSPGPALPTPTRRQRSPTIRASIAANRRRTAEINRLALAKEEVVVTCTTVVLYRPPPSPSHKLPPRKRPASDDDIEWPPARKARKDRPKPRSRKRPASDDDLEEPPARKVRKGAAKPRSASDRPRSRPLPRRSRVPSPSPSPVPSRSRSASPLYEPNPQAVASYLAPSANPPLSGLRQPNESPIEWFMRTVLEDTADEGPYGPDARSTITSYDKDGNEVTLSRSLASEDAEAVALVQSLFDDSRVQHEKTERETEARRRAGAKRRNEEWGGDGDGSESSSEAGPKRRKLEDVKKPYDRKQSQKRED